ncbi:MAG: Gfo/Idh/MocA family oxidoreductase [Burkholderiales bacterium]|nr:Gfo/Idh/MocA family oxidoreductase [Burkholderiales bacterium]
MDSKLTRRKFLEKSAIAAGGVVLLGANAPAPASGQSAARKGANDRIGVGLIGCGGMGNGHLGALTRLKDSGYAVDIVAVCDVYKPRLDAAAARTGGKPYSDFHDLIAATDVDLVGIATPDHWHAPMTIAAADAGKDVYCEKPMTYWGDMSMTRKVVEAIARNKRVMQVGTQGMSDTIWEQTAERIKAGAVGQLVHAQASDMRNGNLGVYNPKSDDGQAKPGTNLDWDMWLGPAKKRPWEPGRFFAFRSFWDYSGGIGTDFFPHILTPLVRTMGLGVPKRVVASGGLYSWKDGRECPDIYNLVIEYADGPSLLLVASLANNNGIPMLIRGHEATVHFEGPGAVIRPQDAVTRDREEEKIERKHGASLEEHYKDLMECARSRDRKPRSNEELGYAVMAALSMGIMSYREGKAAEFDEKSGKITMR